MNDQKLIDACNFIFKLARDGLYQMPDETEHYYNIDTKAWMSRGAIDPIKYCDSMHTIEEFLKSKGVDTYNIHKIIE